jgi:hypothetical protein
LSGIAGMAGAAGKFVFPVDTGEGTTFTAEREPAGFHCAVMRTFTLG